MMDIELKLSPEMVQSAIEIILNDINLTALNISDDDFTDVDLMSYYANRARLYRALRKAQEMTDCDHYFQPNEMMINVCVKCGIEGNAA